MNNLPRRAFLLGWLGGLLAGWLGRPQAQARPSPSATPIGPNSTSSTVTVIAFDGTTTQEGTFEWVIASAPGIGPES